MEDDEILKYLSNNEYGIVINYIHYLMDIKKISTKLLVETMEENIKLKERFNESCRFKGNRENKQKK